MGRTALGLMLLAAGVSAALTWLMMSGGETPTAHDGAASDAERIAQLEAEVDRLTRIDETASPLTAFEAPRGTIPGEAPPTPGSDDPGVAPAAAPPPGPYVKLRGYSRPRGAMVPRNVPPGMRGTPKMWLTGMRIALDKGEANLAYYYQMALTALGDEAIDPTAALLASDGASDELRQHAARALAVLDKQRLSEVAAAWLSTPRDAGPLRTAMLGSISSHTTEIPKPVIDLAWDPEAPHADRGPAIQSMMRVDPEAATRILRRMLRDEGNVGRTTAVQLLTRTTEKPMRPLIEEVARDASPKEQQQLLGALAAMKGPAWGDAQMTGTPDTPVGGDRSTAWASLLAQEGAVTIELDFAQSVVPQALRVHETHNPGALTKIEALVDGEYVTLWSGEAAPAPAPRWFAPRLAAVDAPVRTLRLTLDTDQVKGWNEIDAVELVGDGLRQWAAAARSSSCYARR